MTRSGSRAETGRARLTAAMIVLIFGLGVVLRVIHWRSWPAGPWVDEAYALRAARLVSASNAPLFGTTPLQPPEAGWVNSFPTNLYLRFAAYVDRVAGGGLASFRLLSIGPSVVLLAALFLLAHETSGGLPGAFLSASFLGATSMWLLTTGRWGWDAVATSALLVLSAWNGVRAYRRRSTALAVVSGLLLGLAQYGYLGGRAALTVPFCVCFWAVVKRQRDLARLVTLVLGTTAVVVLPLAVHFVSHPGRALARTREISVLSQPPGAALAALGDNVADYAALFLWKGDANERHGDPGRPIVPAAVAGLCLLGAGMGAIRGGEERFLLVCVVAFLAAGLLARDSEGANAYRVSLMAPFLLLLAARGGGLFLGRFPAGPMVFWILVLVSGAVDVLGFLTWSVSPRTWGAFGGPERELADVLQEERISTGYTEIVLDPNGAARNPYVVDVLLGRPGDGGRPSIRLLALDGPVPWRWQVQGAILYAVRVRPGLVQTIQSLGGRLVRRGVDPQGAETWRVYRQPAREAVVRAQATLDQFPLVRALKSGNLHAREEGLYIFSSRGGLRASLDGKVLFDERERPRGRLIAKLEQGPHVLSIERRAEGAELRVAGPDGFGLDVD